MLTKVRTSLLPIIKRWLAPPAHSFDEDTTRRIYLLNAIIISTTAFVALIFIGNLLGGRTPTPNLLVDLLAIGIAVVFRRWLHQGRVVPVSLAMGISGFLIISAAIASQGTVRTPATATFLFIVVMAGMLYELRGILLTTIASSLAVGGLILAQNAGLLPPPDYTNTISQWVTYTILFGMTGSLAYFAHQITRQALDRAKKEVGERARVETELRKLIRAVEQSPSSIVITNLEGSIEYVNPRFTQVTGYSSAEAVGKNPRILKTDLTPIHTHADMWEALTGGKEWRGEFINRKKDGSLYYESAIISPITDLEGRVTHYLAIKEDITERKRIEDQLRASEARFRSLFEQTHDAVFNFDLDGRYLAVNQRAADMFGFTIDQLLHLSVSDTSAEIDQSRDIIARAIAGEHIPHYERLVRKQDGQVFPVEINLELILDKNGSPSHFQSVMRDISRRKQAEEALKATNEQLNLRVAEVEKLQEELREQALRDPLTGLYNRRYLNETLPREVLRVVREKECLSVIMADIDHFKRINDTYGHQVGDRFLIEVARLLQAATRGSDLVCRYGGEEFLLVLPGTSAASACKRAEILRKKCAALALDCEGQLLSATMSFGVALYPDHGTDAEAIILKADKALYQSKQNGRNQVTLWNDEAPGADPIP